MCFFLVIIFMSNHKSHRFFNDNENFFVTIISVNLEFFQVPLVDQFGRRPLLLYPMCVMAVSALGAFISILLIKNNIGTNWLPYVAIGFIILFVIGFAPGFGNLTAVSHYLT